jgi:hypothetical protein
MLGNECAMCEAVKALITETSLVKFSFITIQQNCIPSPALTSDFRMAVPKNAKKKEATLFWRQVSFSIPIPTIKVFRGFQLAQYKRTNLG